MSDVVHQVHFKNLPANIIGIFSTRWQDDYEQRFSRRHLVLEEDFASHEGNHLLASNANKFGVRLTKNGKAYGAVAELSSNSNGIPRKAKWFLGPDEFPPKARFLLGPDVIIEISVVVVAKAKVAKLSKRIKKNIKRVLCINEE